MSIIDVYLCMCIGPFLDSIHIIILVVLALTLSHQLEGSIGSFSGSYTPCFICSINPFWACEEKNEIILYRWQKNNLDNSVFLFKTLDLCVCVYVCYCVYVCLCVIVHWTASLPPPTLKIHMHGNVMLTCTGISY